MVGGELEDWPFDNWERGKGRWVRMETIFEEWYRILNEREIGRISGNDKSKQGRERLALNYRAKRYPSFFLPFFRLWDSLHGLVERGCISVKSAFFFTGRRDPPRQIVRMKRVVESRLEALPWILTHGPKGNSERGSRERWPLASSTFYSWTTLLRRVHGYSSTPSRISFAIPLDSRETIVF